MKNAEKKLFSLLKKMYYEDGEQVLLEEGFSKEEDLFNIYSILRAITKEPELSEKEIRIINIMYEITPGILFLEDGEHAGYYISLVNKVTNKKYVGFGQTEQEALMEAYLKIPYEEFNLESKK